jgi:hypothetical protein
MQRKNLSADGMINSLKNCFGEIPEYRKNLKNVDISIQDAALSGLAMFLLKYPSVLSFVKDAKGETVEAANLRSMFQIKNVASDTQMRTILDGVHTSDFRKPFLKLFSDAQRGGVLKNFEFIDGKYLAAFDGTGAYSSDKVHCKCCMVKVHKKTEKREEYKSYYHQAVGVSLIHPEFKQVLPLCPEPIQRGDGATKNDCERNATKRVLDDLKKDHPRLPLIIVEDALSANAPHINKIKSCGYNYILGVKPGDHKYLFDWVNSLDHEDIKTHTTSHFEGIKIKKKITYNFKWYNGAPLNDSNSELLINFLDFEEVTETFDKKGENIVKTSKKKFTWVTDLKITKDNVYKLMTGGRARWRIENEVFNTLKNKGYNLEHNFGHGHKNLCNNFIMLMFLAFLMDQLQEIACPMFQKALKKEKRKIYLWEKVRSLFSIFSIRNWNNLFLAIISPPTISLSSA